MAQRKCQLVILKVLRSKILHCIRFINFGNFDHIRYFGHTQDSLSVAVLMVWWLTFHFLPAGRQGHSWLCPLSSAYRSRQSLQPAGRQSRSQNPRALMILIWSIKLWILTFGLSKRQFFQNQKLDRWTSSPPQNWMIWYPQLWISISW